MPRLAVKHGYWDEVEHDIMILLLRHNVNDYEMVRMINRSMSAIIKRRIKYGIYLKRIKNKQMDEIMFTLKLTRYAYEQYISKSVIVSEEYFDIPVCSSIYNFPGLTTMKNNFVTETIDFMNKSSPENYKKYGNWEDQVDQLLREESKLVRRQKREQEYKRQREEREWREKCERREKSRQRDHREYLELQKRREERIRNHKPVDLEEHGNNKKIKQEEEPENKAAETPSTWQSEYSWQAAENPSNWQIEWKAAESSDQSEQIENEEQAKAKQIQKELLRDNFIQTLKNNTEMLDYAIEICNYAFVSRG